MNGKVTIWPRLLILPSLVLLGFSVPDAWSAEPQQLQAPITVVSPEQNLLPHIESLIEILPPSALHPELSDREQTATHAEREIGEIESAIKEAAEESQEMQEEIREIDDD